MRRNRCRCADLSYQVIRIDVRQRVFRLMVVRIPFAVLVVLDLDDRGDALLTEGLFIPSGTASDDACGQVEPIGFEDGTQYLSKS